MNLHVRLHNSDAGTGLLRRINLLPALALCGGQTWRRWPWSPGAINHGTRRQKWCRTEHARQSTYQSPRVQGWRDPRWRTPLIILNNTVTHSEIWLSIAPTGFALRPLRNASFQLCFADDVIMLFGEKCHANMKTSAAATETTVRIAKNRRRLCFLYQHACFSWNR